MKVVVVAITLLCFSTLVKAQYELRPVFVGLDAFSFPLAIINAVDSSGKTFIVEQGGKIRAVQAERESFSKKVFLDLSDTVSPKTGECGLLSLAFHPDFIHNGYLFVFYTTYEKNRFTICLSRFTASPITHDTVLRETEVRFFVDHPLTEYHHGGTLLFGPDHYLYMGMGDCSPVGIDTNGKVYGDIYRFPQNVFFSPGKIHRFDVDHPESEQLYSIPPDNPYAQDTTGKVRSMYALGLRNPWKFSFDDSTGALWLSDVGQTNYEEIDIIEKGKNYGWSWLEGNHRLNDSTASLESLTPPIFEYSHDDGNSCITGGYVYHGAALPQLQGKYIYGDFTSGRIWSFAYDSIGISSNELLIDRTSGVYISTFGRDSVGELLVGDYVSGNIYKLVATDIGAVSEATPASISFKINPSIIHTSNPIVELTFASNSKEQAPISFDLLDNISRVVAHYPITSSLKISGATSINLPQGLPSGLYFLRCNTRSGSITKKLLVVA